MTRDEKLYNLLLEHARIGAPFPSKQAIANATGIPEGSVQMMLDRLCQNGDILIEYKTMTARKRAHIVGTTYATDWSKSHRGPKPGSNLVHRDRYAPEDIASLTVDRDPCFFCGVRGDIGCEHRRAA